MYLHRLELRAIGPFPGTVTIDFAALGASGLFLLEGPTGAGKSTIIDAIVFALYGSLAGDGASTDRLHSHHADPAVEPFVDLVFETGAGVHRVRRTPAYARPKRSGSGVVRQHQSAQLWRLAAPDERVGEPLSDRAQEIGVEIPRIVGLDRAQFVQTVVLPQGEFARFLRSTGEDRRQLLQSIFDTEIYETTTQTLVERRRAAAAAVESADAAVADALSRFRQASGDTEATADSARQVTLLLAADAQRLADDVERARQALALARAAEQEAERRTAALARRQELLERSGALQADREPVLGAQARLERAERASRVLGVIGGLDAARERMTARTAEHRDAVECANDVLVRHRVAVVQSAPDRMAAPGLFHPEHSPSPTPEDHLPEDARISDVSERFDQVALQDRVRTLRDAIAGLTAVLDQLRAVEPRREERAQVGTELDDARLRLAAVEESLAARPSARAALVAQLEAGRTVAADGPAAQADLTAARADVSILDEHEAAVRELDEHAVAVEQASRSATDAIRAETQLRERRVAGLAAELGSQLTPGAACPVCGSVEHPAPAVPTDDHPSAEAIEAAAEQRAAAEERLRAAVARHAACRERRDACAARIGDRTRDSIAEAVSVLEARCRAARDASALVRSTEQELAEFDAAAVELVDRRTTLSNEITAAAARLEAIDAALEAAAVRLADAESTARALGAGPETSLPEALDELAADAESLSRLLRSQDALQSVTADVAAREDEVRRALDKEGLPDAEAAQADALGHEEAAALRQQVSSYEREAAVVAAGLNAPEVAAADGDSDSAIDLGAHRSLAVERAERFEALAAQAVSARERSTQAELCLRALSTAIEARTAIAAETRAAVRLADIATGQAGANPSGITLGTYVLMRRFADVIAAANSRLRSLFGGRFSLEPSEERESGSRSRRTGLALSVRDHHTDRTRDPRSLSGGETFTVSLCLALGLADVVQAEAGGTRLGTLFVDEGFGTLDPETLDDVLGQLARLTADGRQVGIVSHVDELKQRIPERIAVHRHSTGGSTVTTTVS